jgi:hypothetical protein
VSAIDVFGEAIDAGGFGAGSAGWGEDAASVTAIDVSGESAAIGSTIVDLGCGAPSVMPAGKDGADCPLPSLARTGTSTLCALSHWLMTLRIVAGTGCRGRSIR